MKWRSGPPFFPRSVRIASKSTRVLKRTFVAKDELLRYYCVLDGKTRQSSGYGDGTYVLCGIQLLLYRHLFPFCRARRPIAPPFRMKLGFTLHAQHELISISSGSNCHP